MTYDDFPPGPSRSVKSAKSVAGSAPRRAASPVRAGFSTCVSRRSTGRALADKQNNRAQLFEEYNNIDDDLKSSRETVAHERSSSRDTPEFTEF
jgi:hypothetical protein